MLLGKFLVSKTTQDIEMNQIRMSIRYNKTNIILLHKQDMWHSEQSGPLYLGANILSRTKVKPHRHVDIFELENLRPRETE